MCSCFVVLVLFVCLRLLVCLLFCGWCLLILLVVFDCWCRLFDLLLGFAKCLFGFTMNLVIVV